MVGEPAAGGVLPPEPEPLPEPLLPEPDPLPEPDVLPDPLVLPDPDVLPEPLLELEPDVGVPVDAGLPLLSLPPHPARHSAAVISDTKTLDCCTLFMVVLLP